MIKYTKKEKPYLFIWADGCSGNVKFLFLLYDQYLYGAICGFPVFWNIPEAFRKRYISVVPEICCIYLVALMIAALIFLPVVMTLFGTERFQAQNYVPLLYDRIYYEKYLGCLIGENMIQWGVPGYSAVAMAGVFVIFSKRKKYTGLKLGFVLLNLFLLIPFAGHVLNGFSYVSNRWIWAYGMLIAYIFGTDISGTVYTDS